MKRAILTWSALLFCSTCIWAQNPLISPTPQQYITGERSYSLPESFLFNGLNETDSINRSIAQNLLPPKGKSKKYWRLTIGERGDRSVRSVANKSPKRRKVIISASKTRKSWSQEMMNEALYMACTRSSRY